MCVCVCLPHMLKYPQKPAEEIISPRAGDADSCQLLDLHALGTQLRPSERAATTLAFLAISPVHAVSVKINSAFAVLLVCLWILSQK